MDKVMKEQTIHQYIERATGKVVTEDLYQDRIVNTLYSTLREKGRLAFDLLVSPRVSSLIAWVVYDIPRPTLFRNGKINGRSWKANELGGDDPLKDGAFTEGLLSPLVEKLKVRVEECLEPHSLVTPRQIFERKIKYWEFRPMDPDERVAVSPADSRMFPGSFRRTSALFLKEKFFSYTELLGADKGDWLEAFKEGEFAVFRLTPEKYHWNHVPVSGVVRDFYEIEGSCHSCNPGAVVREVTPYSKNRRAVTIIDTDVEGGSRLGLVAMIEVAALMIGDIEQRYSAEKYDAPVPVIPGLFLKRGQPKSLYRPGSSVDVVLFQRGRFQFAEDLVRNSQRLDVYSRYSLPFGRPIVETELPVRSSIGKGI